MTGLLEVTKAKLAKRNYTAIYVYCYEFHLGDYQLSDWRYIFLTQFV